MATRQRQSGSRDAGPHLRPEDLGQRLSIEYLLGPLLQRGGESLCER
jgi:hypothetical protein